MAALQRREALQSTEQQYGSAAEEAVPAQALRLPA
jgi:hypothetical protein